MNTETADIRPHTDWRSASRIAQEMNIPLRTVQYHWENARDMLDLPPSWAVLDPERDAKLRFYIRQKRRNRYRRKKSSRVDVMKS